MKSIIKSFGLLLSFFLSILFFIFLLVFTITSFIRWNFKEEVLTQNIIKLDIYNIKANDILDDERNTNKTLKEALYIICDENNINKTIVEKLEKDKTIEKFLTTYIKSYYDYLLKGKNKKTYKRSDIYNMVSKQDIKLYINNKIDDDLIDEKVDEILISLNESYIDYKEYLNPFYITIINTLFGDNFYKYSLIIIAIFLILLIFFTWSLYKPLKFISTVNLVIGFIYIIMFLIGKFFITYIFKTPGIMENIIRKFSNEILSQALKYGLLILIIGTILFIIYKILEHIFYKEEEFLEDDTLDNINQNFKDKIFK